jgi:hypothetical protein
LACDDHSDLVVGVKLYQRSSRRLGGHDAVIAREASGEVMVQRGEHLTVTIHRQQSRLQFYRGAAVLSIPARFWHERLIGVAPQPVLFRLHRADDLMLWGVLTGVAAGVLVLRGVAATHLTVGHAHAEVNPGVTELETLLAAGRRRRDVANLIKVRALHCRLSP